MLAAGERCVIRKRDIALEWLLFSIGGKYIRKGILGRG